MQKTITAEAIKTGHLHITRKKGICGGEPIIAGTRTPVRSIVGYYRMGMTVDEILEALRKRGIDTISTMEANRKAFSDQDLISPGAFLKL